MTKNDEIPDPHTRRARVAWVVALAFVVLTLFALVAIPIFVQRRAGQMRSVIQASEPTRTLLMELQYNLVRELSSLTRFALSGDSVAVQTFRIARDDERRIWTEMAPMAEQLGAPVSGRFQNARRTAEEWHTRLREEDLLRMGTAGLQTLRAADVRERFEEVLAATAQLDAAILHVTQESRARIVTAERRGMILSLISGALALLASAVVAFLVIRIRKLGIEAERRRREIARALAESALAAEGRQRLLRGITHDVKNPLGAARGYAELLTMGVKGPLNPEQQKLVEGVDRSIDNALAIISDLLDLARADSGGVNINRVEIDLNEIARQAVEDHRAAARAAGHHIEARTGSGTLMSYTDPARVRQVLDNLISNAIKYTASTGTIIVRAEANATDAPFASRSSAIRVIDNGAGIPAKQRERIFDEFTRIDDSDMKGHGLGLAIARRMARLLGGELGLGEHEGRGSTFVLWLPQREQRQTPR